MQTQDTEARLEALSRATCAAMDAIAAQEGGPVEPGKRDRAWATFWVALQQEHDALKAILQPLIADPQNVHQIEIGLAFSIAERAFEVNAMYENVGKVLKNAIECMFNPCPKIADAIQGRI